MVVTDTSERIIELLSFTSADWRISRREQAAVARLVTADRDLDATVRDLHRTGKLVDVFTFMGSTPHRRRVIAELAARTRTQTATARAALIRARRVLAISQSPPRAPYSTFQALAFFDLCRDLAAAARRFGFDSRALPPGAPAPSPARDDRDEPFTGSGATGTNPTALGVPLGDQALLAAGHESTERRYGNPSLDPGFSLLGYLQGLSPQQRLRQAQTLVRQPISTVFPGVYGARPPLRSRVIRAAADHYRLEPALVSAILLTEARDQTRLEDAKDYVAATSVARGNTSIGLGQVVVSTTRDGDLFEALLPPGTRAGLSHDNVATLLASDEFNIFATAAYIRATADQAARLPAGALPGTRAAYSGAGLARYDGALGATLARPVDKTPISFAAFGAHSRSWPEANVMALASEYTSAPWDDRLVELWSAMVLPAYRTFQAGNLF